MPNLGFCPFPLPKRGFGVLLEFGAVDFGFDGELEPKRGFEPVVGPLGFVLLLEPNLGFEPEDGLDGVRAFGLLYEGLREVEGRLLLEALLRLLLLLDLLFASTAVSPIVMSTKPKQTRMINLRPIFIYITPSKTSNPFQGNYQRDKVNATPFCRKTHVFSFMSFR